MSAEWLQFIVFAGGVALAVVQWLFKKYVAALEDNIKDLQENQKEIDKEIRIIKETFVSKVDLRELKEDIIHRLDRIEQHLMGKN